MDFDGTLAEFKIDPAAVTLCPSRQALLQNLAARADISAGIISGRRISDLRDRTVGSATLFYAGVHGLEMEGPGLRYVHPGVGLAAPTLGVLVHELRDATAPLSGVFIEDKGLALVMHLRAASKADRLHAMARFRALAEPHLSGGILRVLPGDQIFELLPNIDWAKGDAVRSIVRHAEAQWGQSIWPVYIGDDETDEDAFEAIGSGGLTIGVGKRAMGASFLLPDPRAVEQFLRGLLATE
jgi:trehalose-phosphatase